MDRVGEERVESAYATYRAGLVRRLTVMTRDAQVAEDLAQDAFLRLAREVDAGRAPDDVAAWLFRVAANLAASRGRRLTVAARHADALEQPGQIGPGPERHALDGERRAALHEALATLPDTDRRALLLAASGVRGPEIAARIARTEGATRTLLYRARLQVRRRLVEAGFASA